MNHSYSRGATLPALLLIACAPAQAFEYRLTTLFSAERSDNVGRASEESGLVQNDTILRPTLRAMLDHEANNFLLSADYLVEHRIYTEDVFNDRTRWTGRADLRWDAVPEFLQFNATNSRTEATEDSLLQNVETNRQVTSVTTLGPTLSFRPRPSDRLALEYSYSDISQGQVNSGATIFENDALINADSQRQSLTLSYEIGFTENRTLTAAISRDEVDFEQNAPELEIDTASLMYTAKGDALEIDVLAGYTTIDRTLGRDEVDGFIGRLNLIWHVSGNGEFELRASRSINDQSDDVLRGSAGFGQGAVFENTDVNEVFDENSVRLSYSHEWGRNRATLAYNMQNQDFDDDAFIPGQSRDEEESGFIAFYTRRLRPNVDLRLGASLLERDFDARGVTEDYFTADFRLDWQVARTLGLFGGVNYEDRDASGTSPLVTQLSFDEFVYFVGFSFDLVNRYKLPQKR